MLIKESIIELIKMIIIIIGCVGTIIGVAIYEETGEFKQQKIKINELERELEEKNAIIIREYGRNFENYNDYLVYRIEINK